MKNTGGRHAGSITAAQFLQRFVNGVPWVHIDIAGTAMGSPSSDINRSWGSGYGVRLLDRLVADNYEVMEISFYHLEGKPLEAELPGLLEKTLARGLRAVVKIGGEERLKALDDLLWTYRE